MFRQGRWPLREPDAIAFIWSGSPIQNRPPRFFQHKPVEKGTPSKKDSTDGPKALKRKLRQ